MLPKRISSLLLIGTLVSVLALPAWGEGIDDMQLFAPSDISSFGNAPRANEGFFFVFDGLVWWISRPDRAPIGFNTTRLVYINETTQAVEQNSLDTGFLEADATGGQRFDIGFIEGHSGWLFSGFRLDRQAQQAMFSDVSVVFSDPPFGSDPNLGHLVGPIDANLLNLQNLPVRFDYLTARNEVTTWAVELNYVYRMHPNHHGGIFELYFGARYLELNEQFDVEALGGTLDESAWYTSADNHIVGPQLGARWFRKGDRWTWSTEGRITAGFNRQNLFQNGYLGTNLNPGTPTQFAISRMGPSRFTHTAYVDEFSPIMEMRVDFTYQITAAISARVGWTGIFIDNVARASSIIDYEVPLMGIDMSRNAVDYVFVNGVTFGVDVNR